jgi:hypothetical protein
METLLYYVRTRVRIATKLTVRWFQEPFFRWKSPKQATHNIVDSGKSSTSAFIKFWSSCCRINSHSERYSLRHQLHLTKYSSPFGTVWEGWLILLSIFACVTYVAQTYRNPFYLVKFYWTVEVFVSQFFAIELIWNTIVAPRWSMHLQNIWTWIDVVTILPIYVSWIAASSAYHVNLSVIRFARVLRVARVLRSFRIIQSMTGITRQIVKIFLTLASVLFIGAGLILILENDINAYTNSSCHFIGELTNYEPSCFHDRPPVDVDNCDCGRFHCEAWYSPYDKEYQPSEITCHLYTFFDTFLFCVYSGTWHATLYMGV